MAAYVYQCLDGNGKKKQGVLEGDSPRQVRQLLRDKGWVPLQVDAATEKNQKKTVSFSSNSLSSADLSLLTRQLATLIQSGLPVEEALGAVARQSEKPRLKSMLLAIRSKVLEGHTLASSLEEYPGSFPDLYRATVAAGEKSGHLDLVLNQLADYTEGRHETVSAIRQALIYPVVLVVFSTAIISLLMTVAVPKIAAVFTRGGQELPTSTKILIASSDFFVSYGVFVFLAIVAFVWWFRKMLEKPAFRKRWHTQLLKVPFIKKLIRIADSARLASTLSILNRSGVPLVDAMRIATAVVSNLKIREAVHDATIKVQEGGSLNRSLDASGHFSPMLIQMISSGEMSGELDEMLDRAAIFQDKELKSILATFLALFAPMTLIVMAVIVFAIVVAMLLPIVQMSSIIG